MHVNTKTAPVPTDEDLLLGFESVGDNCELGLLQRRFGVEPLGLLRFAGAPLGNLVRALNARFSGIADPDQIRVYEVNGEYMVKLVRYDFTHHADAAVGDVAPEAIHAQQCAVVNFLTEKLISDLEGCAKILVFRQNEPLLAGDLADLRIALSAYGPNTLLWVQEACPGHPPGSVDVADERLMIGYVRRLARRDDVPDLDPESWMQVLRRAQAIADRRVDGRLVRSPSDQPAKTEIIFGLDGNAGPCLHEGWSDPEAGYIWSVGERSALTIPSPGAAGEYWLEFDQRPFLSPPLLPRQRLDVSVNGNWVKSFFSLTQGTTGCVIPGHHIGQATSVDITLGHPNAASPMLVAGEGDDRRLAVAFMRLTLFCA